MDTISLTTDPNVALSNLNGAFDSTNGHKHSGAAGDGGSIAGSSIVGAVANATTAVSCSGNSATATIANTINNINTAIIDVSTYGAIGDGDDSKSTANYNAFVNAITALPSTGGIILVPMMGAYYAISQNFSSSLMSKPIKIIGIGPMKYNSNTGGVTLKLTSSVAGTHGFFEIVNQDYIETQNIKIDCNSNCTYGIKIDRLRWGGLKNCVIKNATDTALYIYESNNLANDNTMFCNFEEIWLQAPRALYVGGAYPSIANMCHTVWKNVNCYFTGLGTNPGVDLIAGDNNVFVGFRVTDVNQNSTTGSTRFGGYWEGNSFHQLQPGKLGLYCGANSWSGGSVTNNIIYGYSRQNGEPAPTFAANCAHLVWLESGNGSTLGWQTH